MYLLATTIPRDKCWEATLVVFFGCFVDKIGCARVFYLLHSFNDLLLTVMIGRPFYFYCTFIAFFHAEYLQAFPCYVCNPMYFNYTLTVDSLPAPTRPDCQVITSETGCFVRIALYDDPASGIFYGTNLGLPRETITINLERRVNISSGIYSTINYITYTCGSSETESCNTVENLKRSITAVTLPSKGQLTQFDQLIAPSAVFYSSSCYTYTNMTDYCPGFDLTTCDQCFTVVQYAQSSEICGVCLSDEGERNYLAYDSTFHSNRTQSDTIQLVCQQSNLCNSVANIENVRRMLASQIDYDQFPSSTAVQKMALLPLIISLLMVTIERGLLNRA